ncbi:MAG: hypothetical protein HY683_05350, partial [Chloroflexi bacterium]|nr:hypothetical protein [Chloroflexota bacterium]
LDQGFEAKGVVRLLGAVIDGQLACRCGHFVNPEGVALTLERAEVAAAALLDRVQMDGALNLMYAHVGPLVDDRGSWPASGKLLLEGFEYAALAGDDTPKSARERLDWLRLQPHRQFRPQPYDQLAAVFRRMGRQEDAARVMMAKQDDLVRWGKLGFWNKLWRRFLGFTVGHGYRSERALWGLGGFFAVGALLFWWADLSSLMAPSAAAVLASDSYKATGVAPRDYPAFHAWAYALDTLLPIIDLHQKAFWEPRPATALGLAAFAYLRLHIVAGWVLVSLLAASLLGLVRRLE